MASGPRFAVSNKSRKKTMIDRNSPVTEDELHAYVDDEIAADRRGAVEAWLASHPEDAARVAQWRAPAAAIRARHGMLAPQPGPARLAPPKPPSGERFTIYYGRTDSPQTAMCSRAADRFAAVYWVEHGLAYVVSGPADRERLLNVAQAAYDQIDKSPPQARP